MNFGLISYAKSKTKTYDLDKITATDTSNGQVMSVSQAIINSLVSNTTKTLKSDAIERFVKAYYKKHDIYVHFTNHQGAELFLQPSAVCTMTGFKQLVFLFSIGQNGNLTQFFLELTPGNDSVGNVLFDTLKIKARILSQETL